jgi:hypothetical protein
MTKDEAETLRELAKMVEEQRVRPDNKPRGAARETWDVGFNDAVDEVLVIIRTMLADGGYD